MKVVINACYGGFSCPSSVAELKKDIDPNFYPDEIERDDPDLIAFMTKCHGVSGHLYMVEIPENATDWRVNDYDGFEWVTAVINGKMIDFYPNTRRAK